MASRTTRAARTVAVDGARDTVLHDAAGRMTDGQIKCYTRVPNPHLWNEFITAWVEADTGYRVLKARCTNGCDRFRVSTYHPTRAVLMRPYKYEDAVADDMPEYGVKGAGTLDSEDLAELRGPTIDKIFDELLEPKRKRRRSSAPTSINSRRARNGSRRKAS